MMGERFNQGDAYGRLPDRLGSNDGRSGLFAARAPFEHHLHQIESFHFGGALSSLCALFPVCEEAIPLDRLGPASRPETTPGWDTTAHLKKQVSLDEGFGVQLTTRDIIGLQSRAGAEWIIRTRIDRPSGVGGGLSGSCA